MDGLMFAHRDYDNWPGQQLTIGRTPDSAPDTASVFTTPRHPPPKTTVISRLWGQSSNRRDATRYLRSRINTRAVKISYLKSRAGWNFRAEKNRRAASNLWARHWFGGHLSFIQRPCWMPKKAQNLFIHGPIYRRCSPISRRLVTASIVGLFVVCARA